MQNADAIKSSYTPTFKYPKRIKIAGVIWVAIGVLFIGAAAMIWIATLFSGHPAFDYGLIIGICLIAIMGIFFINIGLPLIRGTSSKTFGTGLGIAFLGGLCLFTIDIHPVLTAKQFGYAVGSVLFPVLLLLTGYMAMSGHWDYVAWKQSQQDQQRDTD